jgi:hypothetical protein
MFSDEIVELSQALAIWHLNKPDPFYPRRHEDKKCFHHSHEIPSKLDAKVRCCYSDYDKAILMWNWQFGKLSTLQLDRFLANML